MSAWTTHYLHTVWVKRPHDDEPWCWGGDSEVAEADECVKRLTAQHPDWIVEYRPPSKAAS